MSKKADIFKALQNRLYEQLEGIEPFQSVWVDKNMGQLSALNTHDTFPLPGILIEFGRGTYRTLSRGVQEWTGIVRLQLIYETLGHSATESQDRDLALEFFEFNELVDDALEGFSGTDFTSLMRIGDEEDNSHEQVVVSVIEYQFSFIDRKQNRQKLTEVSPDLIVTRAKPLSKYVTL
jgi:hypothetical protein